MNTRFAGDEIDFPFVRIDKLNPFIGKIGTLVYEFLGNFCYSTGIGICVTYTNHKTPPKRQYAFTRLAG